MSEDKDKEPQVVYSNQVKEKMEEDPELAKVMREFSACALQAMEGVKAGRYKSFDEAMEAITGQKPTRLDPDDPLYDEVHAVTFDGGAPDDDNGE